MSTPNSQNLWEAYGLSSSPFEVMPVQKDGPVRFSTFEGREREVTRLKTVLGSNSRSLMVVFGEPGVGKTSVVNYVRGELSGVQEGAYVTHQGELDCQEDWTVDNFLQNALYELYASIKRLENKGKLSQLSDILAPIFDPIERTTGVEASAQPFGTGIAVHQSSTSSSRGPELLHQQWLHIMDDVSRKARELGFGGIIFHFNNLENFVLEGETGYLKFKHFLMNARNVFGIVGYHFIFVGNKDARDCFASQQKVSSYVSAQLQLGPLGLNEVKQVLLKRFESLRNPAMTLTAPCTPDAVEFLYHLHDGNIRDILNALNTSTIHVDRGLKKDVVLTSATVAQTLRRYAEDEKGGLSTRQLEVLNLIVQHKEMTNTEISEALGIQDPNSSLLLKKLRERNLVDLLRTEGRNKFYGPSCVSRWIGIDLKRVVQDKMTNWV